MAPELLEALKSALVFGASLILIVTTLVQTLKNLLGLEGTAVKWLALGLGTLVGSLYLIFLFVPLPTVLADYLIRVFAAFVWSFTTPEFYQLLKQSAQRGAEQAIIENVPPVAVVVAETGEVTLVPVVPAPPVE
jgi:hypothetical protein